MIAFGLSQSFCSLSRAQWILFLMLISVAVQVLWMDTKEKRQHTNDQLMLPYAFRGLVVYGFGRGGKQLNCPTANLDRYAVDALPAGFKNGVYGGVARVDNGSYYPMVMSIGYNIQFDSKIKTIETHILKKYSHDFYGSELYGVAFQYIRPMIAFSSLNDLIVAIDKDKSDSLDYIRTNEKYIRSYLENLGHRFEFN